MKSLRVLLPLIVFAVSTAAFTQSAAPKTAAPPSEAQQTFDKMKTLAGTWEGKVTTDLPAAASMSAAPMHVVLRTTSRGNAMLHEMTSSNSPDDPITMFYLENDNLLLTHYCDAGNRPRMQGKLSPDGESVQFEFVDLAGKNQHQHMHDAKFTFIDADHHVENWTFMLGDKVVHAVFDLHRTGGATASK